MAGNPCEPSPCAGVSASLPSNCQCADPGTILAGLNVIVSDSGNCPRRLLPLRDGDLNVLNSFLYLEGNGATPSIKFTQQPAVPYPELAVIANASFGAFVVSTGDSGLHYRLSPPATANLVVQTDGSGGFKLASVPSASVPDPLTVNTLTVLETLNASGQINVGTVYGAAIPSGTIANAVGVSATGFFVKGSPVTQTAKALYYEDTVRDNTQSNFPNKTLLANGNCFIGNELSDVSGLAHVQDSFTIVIDVAGSYQIDWSGCFGKPLASSDANPGVVLLINGSVKNSGMTGLSSSYTNKVGATIIGQHLVTLNNGDLISFKVSSTASASVACQLQNLQLILTRYA